MDVFNWLDDLPKNESDNLVEIRFKNTRKGYFINSSDIALEKGDVVAVEASPGHDIGVVSLTGPLVPVQMKYAGVPVNGLKKIYRKAKAIDVEKWFQSIEREQEIMKIARRMVSTLNIAMKISDVEYQGDKTKATFYYISDERVDFRQLIKDFAEHFMIRIEMKQIGARQDAGKVGGIGTCGRELCCSKWMSSFASVSTSAARYQDMVLNPQKLAGQCGKLKCCLNFEVKCYIDAQKDFPDTNVPLETEQGRAYHFKTDIFRRIIWYSFDRNRDNEDVKPIPIDVDVVKEIIRLNKQGIKAKELMPNEDVKQVKKVDINYQNAVGEDSISRFEEHRGKRKSKRGGKPRQPQTQKPRNETAQQGGQHQNTQPPHEQSQGDQQQNRRPNRNRSRSRGRNDNQKPNPNPKPNQS
jgi:cell fate regulator YaaT (PSP1 superfamily)